MPEAVYAFVVTCPASVLPTAPVEVALPTIDSGTPRKMTVTIPDGHSGLTGIALGYAHQPVIPINPGGYISGNDWTFPFDLSGYPNGPAWSAFVCNGDTQPHSWQVIYEQDNLPDGTGTVSLPPPSAADVMAAATAALGGP